MRSMVWTCLIVAGCQGTAPKSKPITPAPAKTLQVIVLDPEGLPLKGVAIHPSVWTDEEFEEEDGVTDRNGRAVIGLPATFEILRVWATRSPYVPMFLHWETGELKDGTHVVPPEFTVRMTRGISIGGFVHNEDGRPIGGARVEVMREWVEGENEVRMGYDIWLAYGTSAPLTDERGYWSIDNVPPEPSCEVSVKLTHGDYIRDFTWGGMQQGQGVGMDALRARTARLVMRRGIIVTGTVLDDRGRGIEGALVVWGDDPYFEEGSQETVTDMNGHYRLQPLPPGPRNITVMARRWAPELLPVEISKTMHPVDFRMKPGKTIRIRCVDRDGRPVPGAYVNIDGWRGLKSLYNHRHSNVADSWIPWRTDKNGVFEWTWAPDDEVTYEFAAEEYEDLVEKALCAQEETHEVQLLQK